MMNNMRQQQFQFPQNQNFFNQFNYGGNSPQNMKFFPNQAQQMNSAQK